MKTLGLLLWFALATIPPLTEDQRVRLDTAYDGRDHQEEAFVALIENASGWTSGLGDVPVRLKPDIDAMVASPDVYRGELCRIAGVIQQRTRLERPHDQVWEWFVRDDDGRPILVYVVGLTAEDESLFDDGDQVGLIGRFYKRVDADARDGRTRSYPAFVTAVEQIGRAGLDGGADMKGLFTLAAVVLIAAGVLVVLLVVVARRQRGGSRPRRASGVVDGQAAEVDEGGSLPDDPAEALAELKRRAEVDPDANDTVDAPNAEL